MGKDMRGKTRPRKDANTQIIDVGMCVCMCKYMYYTHGNTHTHLCTFHMPKSLSLSSPNNLLLIAFLFLLSSLRRKNCMSPLRLHRLWYSRLWVSSPLPPLSPTSAKVAPSPLVSTHLLTDRISRIRFLNPSTAQTHPVAPCAAQITTSSGGSVQMFCKAAQL